MRVKIQDDSVAVWFSENDTYTWAHIPKYWPCSTLSGKRLVVEYDRNGLCDLRVNGKSDVDVSSDELNALVCHFMRSRLPKYHPCYFVIVGQFIAENSI